MWRWYLYFEVIPSNMGLMSDVSMQWNYFIDVLFISGIKLCFKRSTLWLKYSYDLKVWQKKSTFLQYEILQGIPIKMKDAFQWNFMSNCLMLYCKQCFSIDTLHLGKKLYTKQGTQMMRNRLQQLWWNVGNTDCLQEECAIILSWILF